MKNLTKTQILSGTYIKSTPNELRRIADAMDKELKDNHASAIELTTGVIIYFEREFAPAAVVAFESGDESAHQTIRNH